MSKYNSGVYRIDVGENYYFGLSHDLRSREKSHIKALRRGRHANVHMQRAYSKHGALQFRPLVYCEGDYMIRLEAALIKQHADNSRCMNLVVEVGCGARTHSEETRRKLREACRRRAPASKETRQKIGAASSRTPRTELWRKRISDALSGRKLTDDHRRRMSKRVALTNPNGERMVFDSLANASTHTGIAAATLSRCLTGRVDWSQLRPGTAAAGWTGHYIDKEES